VAGVFDQPLLERWSRGLGSADELLAVLRREGITHVMVNPAEGWRLLDYGIVDWPEQSLALVCRLWERHVVPVHVERVREPYIEGDTVLYLYAISDGPVPARVRPGPTTALAARSPVLWLYEEWWVRQALRHRDAGSQASRRGADAAGRGALELRRELLEGLARRHPEVETFRQRLDELRAAVRHDRVLERGPNGRGSPAGASPAPQSALR
jgi:hypothetical protein